MRPYPSKFEVLKVESVDVWAQAWVLKTQAEKLLATAETNRLRSVNIRARVEESRALRHAARLMEDDTRSHRDRLEDSSRA